jgi:hypothetical protein
LEQSRTATGRGLRALPRPGWRGDVSAALAVVAGEPRLWLLGMLGFLLRGGVLILALPIIVLPTQVEVRLMLGANLGTSGLTPGFFVLAGAAGIIAALMALLALLTVAVVDVVSFEQMVTSPHSLEQRAWREPIELAGATRWRLIRRAYTVQLLALLALVVAALPLAVAINQAILDEVLRPTSNTSIYQRVLFDVRQPLFLFGAAILLIEMFSAAAERELFVRAVGLRGARPTRGRLPALLAGLGRSLGRPLRSPARTVLVAGAGWLMWAAAVAIVVGALVFSWPQVEAAFLALPAAGVPQLVHALALFLVALLLAAVFVLGLLLLGVISAVRAALWTVAGLR